LAGTLSRLVRRAAKIFLSHRWVDLSSLLRNLAISGLGQVVWIVAFFVTLSLVGIDLGPMLAGLGIAGFVIGFALQDTLSNFASGLMIMVYRPFDVGDWVIAAGVSGEVKDVTLVSTVIRTVDNRRITIPNGKVWGDVINNANAEETRRVDLVFGVSHSSDVDKALSVLRDILANDERVLEDPEPVVKVKKLGEFSVDLLCAPWCKTEDYWGLYWDLNRVIKKGFDAEGVSFPFPQMDGSVQLEAAGILPGPLVDSGEE
jgi:small conductance mechanosensitive channel